MEKHVMAEGATKEIIPAIIVVVSDAYASLPPCNPETGPLSNIRKGAVAIVLV